ncbi:hypothetical protein LTR56_022387 [Elasticomyces elasticus]|nr:hypothetical protein LTR56_022387 [Elasticomyces elasticus]KAK3633204.1 hypothetical protein LTR22_020280 [Elasticomyces elasticus]KAK4922391.1 hypothetical protein LTR49_010256 [Elasticomyces elasticus]KAK5765272.1 hypothetical protein LTS12_004529 [Elasticomyces elasticus]
MAQLSSDLTEGDSGSTPRANASLSGLQVRQSHQDVSSNSTLPAAQASSGHNSPAFGQYRVHQPPGASEACSADATQPGLGATNNHFTAPGYAVTAPSSSLDSTPRLEPVSGTAPFAPPARTATLTQPSLSTATTPRDRMRSVFQSPTGLPQAYSSSPTLNSPVFGMRTDFGRMPAPPGFFQYQQKPSTDAMGTTDLQSSNSLKRKAQDSNLDSGLGMERSPRVSRERDNGEEALRVEFFEAEGRVRAAQAQAGKDITAWKKRVNKRYTFNAPVESEELRRRLVVADKDEKLAKAVSVMLTKGI